MLAGLWRAAAWPAAALMVAAGGVAVAGSSGPGRLAGRAALPASPDSSVSRASTAGPGGAGGPGPQAAAPWLAPARGPGILAPGSNPSELPADVLVADHLNNRLLIIDPQGRIRWVFPRHGDLAKGQTFLVPDDAFFSPDGRFIVATQEDDQVISVINVAEHRIVYRYGKPGVPGAGRNRLSNPDDAMMLPGGHIIVSDIRNCRILVLAPPAHRPLRVIGGGYGGCWHAPPGSFGSPNGAFPRRPAGPGRRSGLRVLVTEINGDWVTSLTIARRVRVGWSVHPPGVVYPSDTNQVCPGRLITSDFSYPGQVVEFTPRGRLLWRFGGLNHPSLALPLPNGDILVNDDFNNRIIVIDPVAHRIVWQYGHTGVPGRAPGYLNDPDGVDLVPPHSFLSSPAAPARCAARARLGICPDYARSCLGGLARKHAVKDDQDDKAVVTALSP